MMRRSPSSRRPGLSLLEVLGATAIFLMSIVAISELMNMSTSQAIDVRNRSRATRLCQSKLNEFAAGVLPLNGPTEGDFEEEPDWQWSAEIASESVALNLYRVRVTVARRGGDAEEAISMTQIVFDPSQRGQLTGSTTSPDSSGAGSSTGTASGSGAGTSTGGSGSGSGGSSGGGSRGGTGGNSGGSGIGGGRGGLGGGGSGGGTGTGGLGGGGGLGGIGGGKGGLGGTGGGSKR